MYLQIALLSTEKFTRNCETSYGNNFGNRNSIRQKNKGLRVFILFTLIVRQ